MTDDMGYDLVKELRESAKATFYDPLKFELNRAADRIEKLEAANLKQSCIKVDDQMRIEKLEAALRVLSDGWDCCFVSQAMKCVAHKALEGKDD